MVFRLITFCMQTYVFFTLHIIIFVVEEYKLQASASDRSKVYFLRDSIMFGRITS